MIDQSHLTLLEMRRQRSEAGSVGEESWLTGILFWEEQGIIRHTV